jgi:hypothetical protein
VRVAGAGQAPDVVGQDGDGAYTEVNVNYPACRSRRTSFRNTNSNAVTGRRSPVSTGQTQPIKRLAGSVSRYFPLVLAPVAPSL